MNEALEFITTKRQHLVSMTHTLIGGIGDEFMENAANPVVITVRGTFKNGKKIIPDTAVQKLFGIKDARDKLLYAPSAAFAGYHPVYTGNDECDEYWLGRHDGILAEITFINADVRDNFFSQPGISEGAGGMSTEDSILVKAQNFLKIRKHGGISFITVMLWRKLARGSIYGWNNKMRELLEASPVYPCRLPIPCGNYS